MTPAKYMTKKEKKLYRRYLSELHITNLYQLTKLLIDILSCKKDTENYITVNEYFKESVDQLFAYALQPKEGFVMGNDSSYSKKGLVSLCTYAMATLDMAIPAARSSILYLLDTVEDFLGEQHYQTLKRNLYNFSKLISENEFSSAENIDTGKDSDVKMENDNEVFTPYSLFPAEDLEDFLSDDPEEEDDLYWDKEEADGLNWNWDEEEDDDINNDCEGDFDDDFCTF